MYVDIYIYYIYYIIYIIYIYMPQCSKHPLSRVFLCDLTRPMRSMGFSVKSPSEDDGYLHRFRK